MWSRSVTRSAGRCLTGASSGGRSRSRRCSRPHGQSRGRSAWWRGRHRARRPPRDAGRLIATTNVRHQTPRQAARLRVRHQRGRRAEPLRTVGDLPLHPGPSACLERFTHTPAADRRTGPPDGVAATTDVEQPRPTDPDTASTAAAPGADMPDHQGRHPPVRADPGSIPRFGRVGRSVAALSLL
jgi:hypothetical protein